MFYITDFERFFVPKCVIMHFKILILMQFVFFLNEVVSPKLFFLNWNQMKYQGVFMPCGLRNTAINLSETAIVATNSPDMAVNHPCPNEGWDQDVATCCDISCSQFITRSGILPLNLHDFIDPGDLELGSSFFTPDFRFQLPEFTILKSSEWNIQTLYTITLSPMNHECFSSKFISG